MRWIAPLFAAILSVALLVTTYPQHTYAADTTTSFAPADLLSPSALDDPASISVATPAQSQSLATLQQQAVTNTLHDHGLPASDTAAVQTWGRADAEGELWALLVQAIKTPACTSSQTPGQGCRTADQENAVGWLTAMFKAQTIRSAQSAGLEYTKWAGLDQGTYGSLLGNNASVSALSTFLSGNVLNFGSNNSGYCNYRSPTPYGDEYQGFNDQTCFTPCTNLFGCTPPTPTYDQFVKWGEADVNNQLFNNGDYAAASRTIATSVAFAAGVLAAGTAGAVLSSALVGVVTGSALQVALFPYLAIPVAATQFSAGAATAAEAAAIAGGATAATIAAVAVTVLIAITVAVIQGISIFNAAAVPGELANLIVQARTSTVDLNAILNDGTQAQGLFGLFVGATTPSPRLATCDNSVIPVTNAGVQAPPPCLNAPAIPAASATDPLFKVTQQGATTSTFQRSISLQDVTQNIALTTRVSGDRWFVNQVTASDNSTATVQSLRLRYTDWSGKGNTAWLVGNGTDGYQFVGLPDGAPSGPALNPTTCLTDKTCFASSSINYVGTDGKDYTASLVANVNPVVTVNSSLNPVEGTAQSFSASATSPIGQSVTYSWEFEQQADATCDLNGVCSLSNVDCTSNGCAPNGGPYGAPVSGAEASYTWPRSGTWHVRVTATDALGNTTVKTISVSVAAVTPTLAVNPAVGSTGCTTNVVCDVRTVDLGNAVTLTGIVGHAGSGDEETVHIDWGDGQSNSAKLGWNSIYSATGLTISRASDTVASFSGTHTYASFGYYSPKVTVTDATWASVTGSANMIIRTTPAISLVAPLTITYGTKLDASSKASALPGALFVFGTYSYSVDGKPTPLGTVLPAGPHTLSVNFTPDDPTLFKVPPTVSQPLQVQPAPLTVTADNQHMTLHGTVPTLTYSYGGFVNQEGASALMTLPNCSTTASSASAIGSYPITCSGGSAGNYAFTYKPGTLSVLYGWSGFTQPINDPTAGATTMSVFKAGGTIAVKFQLKDARGMVVQAGTPPVFSVTSPQTCSTGTVAINPSTTTAGDTGTTYRWDAKAKQYVYNYKTPINPGMCQYVQATLDDGTTQKVLVGYR